MAFNWRDGITFERQADGAVTVVTPSEMFTIPAAEWASIIAAVSARGETADTYQEALSFHNELVGRREPAGG